MRRSGEKLVLTNPDDAKTVARVIMVATIWPKDRLADPGVRTGETSILKRLEAALRAANRAGAFPVYLESSEVSALGVICGVAERNVASAVACLGEVAAELGVSKEVALHQMTWNGAEVIKDAGIIAGGEHPEAVEELSTLLEQMGVPKTLPEAAA